jgi:hypothetical protein
MMAQRDENRSPSDALPHGVTSALRSPLPLAWRRIMAIHSDLSFAAALYSLNEAKRGKV